MSEKEKKDQFVPGARFGRKLKGDEVCYADKTLWSKATERAFQLRIVDEDGVAIAET